MNTMFDLTGKTALVTGSGRGIGFTLAKGLASAGARVIINDLNADIAEAAVEQLRAEGVDACPAVFDVTDKQAVTEGIDGAVREAGQIDILVNNAGIHRRAPLEEMAEEDWKKVLDTNLTSAFLVGQRVARDMIRRRSGKIINILSINSERPRPSIGNYSAAKGGLTLLTRSMTVEWAQHNIQINGIAPGYILTEMTMPLSQDPEKNAWIKSITPARRWGTPEDLIGAAVFLSSKASQFVNGHVLFVDGGMRVGL